MITLRNSGLKKIINGRFINHHQVIITSNPVEKYNVAIKDYFTNFEITSINKKSIGFLVNTDDIL